MLQEGQIVSLGNIVRLEENKELLGSKEPVCDTIYIEIVSPDEEHIAAKGIAQSVSGLEHTFSLLTGYLNMGTPDSTFSKYKVNFSKALIKDKNGEETIVVGESLGDHAQDGLQQAEDFLASLAEVE